MNHRANADRMDDVLSPWRDVIGKDYERYRNHAVRMASFCLMLEPDCSDTDRQKIETAACFHDIGIWTADTLDYLEPSVPPAMKYLEDHDLTEWAPEMSEMILEHHKIRTVKRGLSPLVELFRKGDLVDFSKGMVKFGLPRSAVSDVMQEYPNVGFHGMLMKRVGKWVVKHPLNPLPMMKW